jgi:DNA-binding transcriptional ArsR family regulator
MVLGLRWVGVWSGGNCSDDGASPIVVRVVALDRQPNSCILAAMADVFRALADASRRALLDRLRARNGQTLSELAEHLRDMSRQAVSKHVAVLEAADLVVTIRRGREKLHYLNPGPIHEIARRWISEYEKTRVAALADLKRALEEEHHHG